MTRPIQRCAASLAALAVLAGCASAPPYERPAVDVPAAYAEAGAGWSPATPQDDSARGAWWKVFGDPVLDDLEARVDVSNQTLKKSLAQLAQARAGVGYQQAGWWPSVGIGATASRARTSNNVEGKSLAGKTVNDYLLGFSASWEPDLFGRIASAVSAAQADAQASAADVESVRLSLNAELAADYVALRFNEADRALLEQTLANDDAALQLAKNQFAAGYASALDQAEAQNQFDSVQTLAIDLGAEHARLTHAIATLVGVPAAQFKIEPAAAPLQLPSIPAGLPSQLLERRPDVAAAERRVAAMNAQIGVARAAFYPDLALTLLGGVESSLAGSLLSAPSRFWSLGPSLALPLFDGGRRKATLHATEAEYDATVADYRQTVVSALNQVEDQLAALRVYRDEAASQQRAVASSSLALTLALNRYQAGAVSYLEVVAAQGAALQNQRAALALNRRRLQASVALLQALGGGWSGLAAEAHGAPVSSAMAPATRVSAAGADAMGAQAEPAKVVSAAEGPPQQATHFKDPR